MLPIRSNASSKLPIWANTAGRLPVWAYTTQPPTPTCIALYAVFGQGKYIYQYFLSFIFSGSVCTWVCTVVICYRPQRSCEGYVFTPVCHYVSRGRGVCLSACWNTTPREQTPRTRLLPPGKTAAAADGTHPTGMHSCSWWVRCRRYLVKEIYLLFKTKKC